MVVLLAFLWSTETNHTAIRTVVRDAYVVGFYQTRDPAAMNAGMHPRFRMVSRHKGVLGTYTRDDLAKPSKTRKKNPVSVEISQIYQTGRIAVVRLEVVRDGKHLYTDFLGLCKTPEGWRLTTKTYDLRPREKKTRQERDHAEIRAELQIGYIEAALIKKRPHRLRKHFHEAYRRCEMQMDRLAVSTRDDWIEEHWDSDRSFLNDIEWTVRDVASAGDLGLVRVEGQRTGRTIAVDLLIYHRFEEGWRCIESLHDVTTNLGE